jgi:hypothetical protein
MVTEMWQSGAEWMVRYFHLFINKLTNMYRCIKVIIDHGTPAGFDSVAQARELLLDLGRNEVSSQVEQSNESGRVPGSHVVAPVSSHLLIQTLLSTTHYSAPTLMHAHCTVHKIPEISATSLKGFKHHLFCDIPNILVRATKMWPTLMWSYGGGW